ncbi:cell division protein FtsL [Roseibium algae]|uniref:Cell division protein FtsL n=1 Tax=Roseibium algae TaxID=3123038 RepID=A0ABU8TKJ1_9HYPH
MVRYINIFFILLVVVCAAAVYDMKLAAKKSASYVSELQREIEAERETLRNLRAEWSVLNQPERLQRLVERYNEYLELQPLDVHQIVRAEELPARPVMLEPIGGSDHMGGYAGSSTAVR